MHPLENKNAFKRRVFLVFVAVPCLAVYLVCTEGWEILRQVATDLAGLVTDEWDLITDRCSYIAACLGRATKLWATPGKPSEESKPESHEEEPS